MKSRIKNAVHCLNDNILFGSSIQYPPFPKHYLHTHERCEIFYIIRGNGHYITEGARNRLEHGRIFLMRPGEMHMIDLKDDEPREAIALHFAPSIIDCIDSERSLLSPFYDRPLGMHNVYDRSAVASTDIYSMFQKMRELGSDNYKNCTHVSAILFAILSELRKLFEDKCYTEPAKNAEVMHSIVGYVNDNLTLEITPELLCEKFHFCRGQLDRNFKHTTGFTTCAYITAKRLLLAKAYIDEGMNITDAAFACGFRNYTTFYRAYRKHFCCAPTENSENTHLSFSLLRPN